MPLLPDQKEEYLNALCNITRVDRVNELYGARGNGNGVFITPSHVLTAWHVITGASKSGLEFENCDGETARMKDGGFKKRDAASDLCLIELDKPIGKDYYIRPVNKHILKNNNFSGDKNLGNVVAKNIYGNKQVVEEVSKPHLSFAGNFDQYEIDHDSGQNIGALYNYKVREPLMHKGHSGAPVINNNGHVVSILSLMEDIGKRIDGIPGTPDVAVSDALYGASPEQVAAFVDDFLFSPESVHCAHLDDDAPQCDV